MVIIVGCTALPASVVAIGVVARVAGAFMHPLQIVKQILWVSLAFAKFANNIALGAANDERESVVHRASGVAFPSITSRFFRL
ncbi:MAG: hypothetical protein ACR5K7_03605 [Symbiopectobacterium sp.]